MEIYAVMDVTCREESFIIALCLDKEKAQKIAAAQKDPMFVEIETWEDGLTHEDISAEKQKDGFFAWEVVMQHNGDNVVEKHVWASSLLLSKEQRLWNEGRWEKQPLPWIELRGVVWARDEQHVVEIANEQRLEWIADGTWEE